MARQRTYEDPCGIARGLDIVGSRWTLLVVRELVLGPKRFGDIRAGLPGISAETLAQRLRDLERDGVVARRELPPPASATVYELTAWGAELKPVVIAMGRWGSRAPFPLGEMALSPDALMLALPTTFDGARGGEDAEWSVRLGADRFAVTLDHGALDVRRGEPEVPAATLSASPAALTRVLWHGWPLEEAESAGELSVEGSRRAARRFLALFPAPVPA